MLPVPKGRGTGAAIVVDSAGKENGPAVFLSYLPYSNEGSYGELSHWSVLRKINGTWFQLSVVSSGFLSV